jgi:hypothetical protein
VITDVYGGDGENFCHNESLQPSPTKRFNIMPEYKTIRLHRETYDELLEYGITEFGTDRVPKDVLVATLLDTVQED